MNSTRRPGQIVLLLLAAFCGLVGIADPAPPRQASGQPKGLQSALASFPASQSKEHAPLQVDSVRMKGGNGPIWIIEVYNASHKTILSYTLGWNITDAEPGSFPTPHSGKKSLGASVGSSVTTNLKAKKSEKTDQGESLTKFLKTQLKTGIPKGIWIAVVGVTDVVFEDGTHWSADPALFHLKD